MTEELRPGALVVYKGKPARVEKLAGRVLLRFPQGETARVRPKDVLLLHPGPVQLERLPQGPWPSLEEAWELALDEAELNLATLTELVLGQYTPEHAWAVWQAVQHSDWFTGTPQALRARTREEIQRLQAQREAQRQREAAWKSFLERARKDQVDPEQDARFLQEVIALALQRTERSRVLQALGRKQTPEEAHALLLRWGVWSPRENPYPRRFGLDLTPPQTALPPLPEEDRLDLTHLPAYAIDDAGSQDPDDALSWDGTYLWIHVADVAALVTPDSPADLEARRRGSSVYLPEAILPMLPDQARQLLALGLQPVSPALSIGVRLNPQGEIEDVRIHPAWVRVTRMSYEEAEARWEADPLLPQLEQALAPFAERRRRQGAVDIRLPEVKVVVEEDGQIRIKPLVWNRSRRLVQEAMLLAGEAVARFAQSRGIPLPYTVQPPPREPSGPLPDGLAGMYARRRLLAPSEYSTHPGVHHGLGLPVYVQATSPLRRYLDLVVHQQLRAYLQGRDLLGENALLVDRVGPAEAARRVVRQVERLSRLHWIGVYLLENPEWTGTGVVVDVRGTRSVVLIPELGIEAQVSLPYSLPLNAQVRLRLQKVHLPYRTFHFRVEGEA